MIACVPKIIEINSILIRKMSKTWIETTRPWQTIVAILMVASPIFIGLYLIWFVKWMQDVEKKCECGAITRSHFMIWYMRIVAVLIIILGILQWFIYGVTLQVLLTGVIISFLVVSKIFIERVRRDTCKCSDSVTLSILDIWIYIYAAMLIFQLVFLIIWTNSARSGSKGLMSDTVQLIKR